MDISDIVNWGTLFIWVVGGILYIADLARGGRQLHPWLKWLISSKVVLGLVILAGLIMSGFQLYPTLAREFGWQSVTVTISAYNTGTNSSLKIISGQTFENADVPLDGYSYNECTFINSCLLYDGGPYQLQNSTFKKHWAVCVKENSSLMSYSSLLFALDPRITPRRSHKTLVVSHH
jgi:hypothetical protein